MRARLLGVGLLLALSACVPPREWLFPKLGVSVPRLADFPPGFTPPLSAETGQPMSGFGGPSAPGQHGVPVIFVHGNTVGARFWKPARAHFLAHGYTPDQLWALGYGWDNVHYFDSADLSVVSLDRFVEAVTQYLAQQRGEPVPQVDIVAHSLGVTLVRQWMLQTNNYHRVRSFIGVAGANQGVWTASNAPRGQQRAVSWELAPQSPWLAQLNAHGQTPGGTRYMTLYDGTGRGDVLFPYPLQDSSALDGAENLAFNRERGTLYGHLELPREPKTMTAMRDFLARAPQPDASAAAPVLMRSGNRIYPNQPGARLHCEVHGRYPNAQTAEHSEWALTQDSTVTCFARHPRTGLASPMARYRKAGSERPGAPPMLSANLVSGRYAQAQWLRLQATPPEALITYRIDGGVPDSGSALYTDARGGVFLPATARITAVAQDGDGQRSAPLVLDVVISHHEELRQNSLAAQFDAEPAAVSPRDMP